MKKQSKNCQIVNVRIQCHLFELIRVIFLQYKIWENGILYFSQARNLKPQLRRMKTLLCNQGGFCLTERKKYGQKAFKNGGVLTLFLIVIIFFFTPLNITRRE